jgi:hypothetical protein
VIPESQASTYRDAAYAALRDLDAYAEAAAEEAQTLPLAVRARLRADLETLDRDAARPRATGARVDPASISAHQRPVMRRDDDYGPSALDEHPRMP